MERVGQLNDVVHQNSGTGWSLGATKGMTLIQRTTFTQCCPGEGQWKRDKGWSTYLGVLPPARSHATDAEAASSLNSSNTPNPSPRHR